MTREEEQKRKLGRKKDESWNRTAGLLRRYRSFDLGTVPGKKVKRKGKKTRPFRPRIEHHILRETSQHQDHRRWPVKQWAKENTNNKQDKK